MFRWSPWCLGRYLCDARVLKDRSDEPQSSSVVYALRARAPGNTSAWAEFTVAGQRRCVLLTGQVLGPRVQLSH
jgi:hypothetical protein